MNRQEKKQENRSQKLFQGNCKTAAFIQIPSGIGFQNSEHCCLVHGMKKDQQERYGLSKIQM